MSRFKQDYKFNFGKAMKFFLTTLDKTIDKNDLYHKDIKITLTVRCSSYPFHIDVMNLITKTYAVRGFKVESTSYKVSFENDTNKYEYKFTLEQK